MINYEVFPKAVTNNRSRLVQKKKIITGPDSEHEHHDEFFTNKNGRYKLNVHGDQ